MKEDISELMELVEKTNEIVKTTNNPMVVFEGLEAMCKVLLELRAQQRMRNE